MYPVVATTAGSVARVEQWLARARCTKCRTSFTVYAPGSYPRRQFQLDVVAAAAAMYSGGKQSARDVAVTVMASATSVRRWARWAADLVDPADALAAAARIDSEGVHGAGSAARDDGPDHPRSRVWRVLDALEALGVALMRGGAKLAHATGLGRVLEWQFLTHGVFVALRGDRSSPRMALGP